MSATETACSYCGIVGKIHWTDAIGCKEFELRKGGLMNTDYLLQFFTYAHLPERLQAVSKPFGMLAEQIMADLPANPERTVALRKLLEAKDCAVRALLFK